MSATVRAGYKQTEVGVIPEDWEVKSVKDFAVVKGGKRLPIGKSVINKVTSHPYLRVTDMLQGGVDLRDIKYVPEEVFPFIKNYRIGVGDIFISVAGTLGIVGKVPLALDGANLTENADKITSIACDQDFLLYNLMSDRVQGIIESEKTVGAQPKLAIARIENFSVALPPTRAEQCDIATALSDVDALLSKLDALIAKKRDLKQAAMQQLLTGRTRLPGFCGEWKLRPLRSVVADLEAGISVNSIEHEYPLSSGEPCILKTSAILDGQFDPEECKLIAGRDIKRAKLSPKRDTIIVSRMNTPNLVGEVGYVAQDFPTLNLPDRLWMTRFHSGADINARWLAYVLSSPHAKDSIKGLATGTSGSMKNIGKSALLALPLEFPAGEEQTAIATVLSDMDAELTALEARRDKTRALKQGMMQELLTGRIRLVVTTPLQNKNMRLAIIRLY